MRSKGGILALSTIGIAAALLIVIAPGVRSSPHQPSVPETPVVLDSSSVPSLEFILSSFNVLGSRHTAPGNTRDDMAPGPIRIRWVARLLSRHDVDVVGFQELQLDQLDAFLRVTGETYDVYPGSAKGGRGSNNSIAWRTQTWQLADAYTIPVPYFNGKRWPMPVVLLRNRSTGLSAYFTNFHNPASTRRHPNQRRWRRAALEQEVAMVNRLVRETDDPVFLTGDLNSRKVAFCTLTGRAGMIAANGGSNDGSCQPPDPLDIDWIFGSDGVTFSGYLADQGRLVSKSSDHPMLVTHVRIGGKP